MSAAVDAEAQIIVAQDVTQSATIAPRPRRGADRLRKSSDDHDPDGAGAGARGLNLMLSRIEQPVGAIEPYTLEQLRSRLPWFGIAVVRLT